MENKKSEEDFNKLFISESLKRLRLKHDLSTTDVAKIISKSRQGYLNYETAAREIGIRDLITLSGFYNTSIDVIVGNPFTLRNNSSLSFRSYEMIDGALKEVMPYTISTMLDDVICVTEDELSRLFFWKTTTIQKGRIMLFEYYNKPYISKVHYNHYGGGHFYINDEPFYFNKAQAENIAFKGVLMSTLEKDMSIPNFF